LFLTLISQLREILISSVKVPSVYGHGHAVKARVGRHQIIVLSELIGEQQDSTDHAKIRKDRDGLTEIELLQFCSPRYAPACILTVNERLLSAAVSIGERNT